MNPLKPSFIFPEPVRSPEGRGGGWGSTQVLDIDSAVINAAVPVNDATVNDATVELAPAPEPA